MSALAKDPATGKFLKKKAKAEKPAGFSGPVAKPKPIVRRETFWEWITGAHA